MSIHLCKFALTIFFRLFSHQYHFFLFFFQKKGDIRMWFCYKKKTRKSHKFRRVARRWAVFLKKSYLCIFEQKNIKKTDFRWGLKTLFWKKKRILTVYTIFTKLFHFHASIIVYLSLLKQNRRIVCMYVLPFTSLTKTKGFLQLILLVYKTKSKKIPSSSSNQINHSLH